MFDPQDFLTIFARDLRRKRSNRSQQSTSDISNILNAYKQQTKGLDSNQDFAPRTTNKTFGSGATIPVKFDQALTPESYNQLATALQTNLGATDILSGKYPTGVSGTEVWEYDGSNIGSAPSIATNPAVALRMGVPIDRDLVAAEIANRRGTAVDDSAYHRADWRIGNQLYRQNVRAGLAEPGTYARQGGGLRRHGLR